MQTILDKQKYTMARLEEELEYHKIRDQNLKEKAEFMYNYFDFESDRAKVRDRFIKEMNKKTTLRDIGDTLDRLILNEKGEMGKYYDPEKHAFEKPEWATKDINSYYDLNWVGRIAKNNDPIKPCKINYFHQFNSVS